MKRTEAVLCRYSHVWFLSAFRESAERRTGSLKGLALRSQLGFAFSSRWTKEWRGGTDVAGFPTFMFFQPLNVWLIEADGIKKPISCREICENFDPTIIDRLRIGIDSGADVSTVELD